MLRKSESIADRWGMCRIIDINPRGNEELKREARAATQHRTRYAREETLQRALDGGAGSMDDSKTSSADGMCGYAGIARSTAT